MYVLPSVCAWTQRLTSGKEVRVQRNALKIVESVKKTNSENEEESLDEIEIESDLENDDDDALKSRETNTRKRERAGEKDAGRSSQGRSGQAANASGPRETRHQATSSNHGKRSRGEANATNGNTSSRDEPGVSFRRKSDRKKEKERLSETGTRVNFAKLETSALRRYKSHYKLPDSGFDTNDQLVSSVTSHFRQYSVPEKEVIMQFLHTNLMRNAKA